MTTWRFDLEVGQEFITLPNECKPDRISSIYLLDLRKRHINLMPMSLEEVKELGRSFVFSADEKGLVHTPILGFPLYYVVKGRNILIWPRPAHAWSGCIEEKTDASHENQ